MKTARLVVGLTLVCFPLAVQVPFGLLAIRFGYPDILLAGGSEVLPRFHAGGTSLVLTWYFYALCTLGLLPTALMLPEALDQRGRLAQFSVVAGVTAGLTQLLGLLRWTLVVPMLAQRWVERPLEQAAIEQSYELQHRLFGALVGEHVGQLFMGLWTVAVALLLLRTGGPRWLAVGGLVAGGLFLLGLGAGLARALPLPAALGQVPMLAFVLWSAWSVALGGLLLRRRNRSQKGE